MDVIIALSFVLSIPLFFRGIIILYEEKSRIKTLIGVSINVSCLKVITFFFFIISLLFFLVFYLNHHLGYLKFDFVFDLHQLLKDLGLTFVFAFLEEFFFRVLLLIALWDIVKGAKRIVFVTSILFALFHVPNSSIEFASYFLAGIIYGFSYLKFQNILIPTFIHWSWNFIQGSIFGFSVSGVKSIGVFQIEVSESVFWNGEPQGPEGSWIGLAIRLIVIFFIFLYPVKTEKQGFMIFKKL